MASNNIKIEIKVADLIGYCETNGLIIIPDTVDVDKAWEISSSVYKMLEGYTEPEQVLPVIKQENHELVNAFLKVFKEQAF